MNYRQAVDYLLAFADYERSSTPRIRYREFNLQRVRDLLDRLGGPDASLSAVQIAGTKGKGSTAAMTASVLRAAGYRTGLFTSPHLHTIRERIAVDGAPIPEAEFAGCVEAMEPAVEAASAGSAFGRLTTFELLTALAFQHFRQRGVEQAVVEVGLGGRLDATSVLTPVVSAITNISLDHVEVLGDSVRRIAGEKAAIIKPSVPVVCAPQPTEALEVVSRTAHERGAPLILVGRDVTWRAGESDLEGQRLVVRSANGERHLWLPLLGRHQAENAATSVAVCEALSERGVAVGFDAVAKGLARVSWPGRMEVLARDPLTIADGAHNPYSLRRLREAVEALPHRRAVVIFGATRSKNLGGMLDELAGLPRRFIATQSRHPKSAPSSHLRREAEDRGLEVEQAETPAEALALARDLAGRGDLILATGSLFVVAEIREAALGIEPEIYAAGGGVFV